MATNTKARAKTMGELTPGQRRKKIEWGTVTIRRSTLATFRDIVARDGHASVAEFLDKLAAQCADQQAQKAAQDDK